MCGHRHRLLSCNGLSYKLIFKVKKLIEWMNLPFSETIKNSTNFDLLIAKADESESERLSARMKMETFRIDFGGGQEKWLRMKKPRKTTQWISKLIETVIHHRRLKFTFSSSMFSFLRYECQNNDNFIHFPDNWYRKENNNGSFNANANSFQWMKP